MMHNATLLIFDTTQFSRFEAIIIFFRKNSFGCICFMFWSRTGVLFPPYMYVRFIRFSLVRIIQWPLIGK